MKVYCRSCGKEIEKENSFEYCGQYYCDDCISECEDCGAVFPTEYLHYVDSCDYLICDYCLDNYYVCGKCGEILPFDKALKVYTNSEGTSHKYYCEGCAEDIGVYECAECGDLFIDYSCGRYDFDNDWYCHQCVGEGAGNFGYPYSIQDYHYHKDDYTTYGDKAEIGIELEIDSGHYSMDREYCSKEIYDVFGERFFFEDDGSLSNGGFEIISQPHSLEEFNKIDFETLLSICKNNGYTSHDNGNCGLHIHYSRNLFGNTYEEQTDNIAKLITFFDKFWADIARISRRRDFNYCRKIPVIIKKDDSVKERISKSKELINGYNDRYDAINLRNDHTVEIRVMRGTLNLKSFTACIEFCTNLVKKCTELDEQEILDCKNWLKDLSENCVEYIKRRQAFTGVDISAVDEAIRNYQYTETNDDFGSVDINPLRSLLEVAQSFDETYAMA